MFYPWLLTVGALIVLYFAASGALSGEYGGKYYTVRRATEPFGFWLRIVLAAAAALLCLAVAWLSFDMRNIVIGMGLVLMLCSAVSAAWGETVVYRRVPLRRRESPVRFWLHVLSMQAAGCAVLILPWLLRK
jgi:hypothetical protein